jgi:probable rRNA maturation factor
MKLPSIKVHNRQRQVAIDRNELQAFARRALPLCLEKNRSGQMEFSEIDVILVSDRRMAQLHHRFMGIDGPTDVITFQHGEIFLSVEMAKRQAASYHTSFQHELRLYLVHGLLHLAGYDDREALVRRQMERTQEKIVARAAA